MMFLTRKYCFCKLICYKGVSGCQDAVIGLLRYSQWLLELFYGVDQVRLQNKNKKVSLLRSKMFVDIQNPLELLKPFFMNKHDFLTTRITLSTPFQQLKDNWCWFSWGRRERHSQSVSHWVLRCCRLWRAWRSRPRCTTARSRSACCCW